MPGIKHHVKNPENTTQIFNQYRALLFSIAYRMLCNATDAEDIVQEAFVRWLQASDGEIQSPKAFLSTVVTRLCIDQLRSARARTLRWPLAARAYPNGPAARSDRDGHSGRVALLRLSGDAGKPRAA